MNQPEGGAPDLDSPPRRGECPATICRRFKLLPPLPTVGRVSLGRAIHAPDEMPIAGVSGNSQAGRVARAGSITARGECSGPPGGRFRSRLQIERGRLVGSVQICTHVHEDSRRPSPPRGLQNRGVSVFLAKTTVWPRFFSDPGETGGYLPAAPKRERSVARTEQPGRPPPRARWRCGPRCGPASGRSQPGFRPAPAGDQGAVSAAFRAASS